MTYGKVGPAQTGSEGGRGGAGEAWEGSLGAVCVAQGGLRQGESCTDG